MENSKRAVSVTFPHEKIQTPQEEVRKSHEKYEIQILYFSCKYGYNISYKHLKQAFQNTYTQRQQSKTKNLLLRRNNIMIKQHTTIKLLTINERYEISPHTGFT